MVYKLGVTVKNIDIKIYKKRVPKLPNVTRDDLKNCFFKAT